MASADLLAVLSEAVESLGARRAELHEPVADRAVDVVVQVASEADHAALDRPNRSANRQVSAMALIAPAEGSTSSATSSETLAASTARADRRKRRHETSTTLPLPPAMPLDEASLDLKRRAREASAQKSEARRTLHPAPLAPGVPATLG